MIGYALGAWTNSLYVDLTGNFTVLFYFFIFFIYLIQSTRVHMS